MAFFDENWLFLSKKLRYGEVRSGPVSKFPDRSGSGPVKVGPVDHNLKKLVYEPTPNLGVRPKPNSLAKLTEQFGRTVPKNVMELVLKQILRLFRRAYLNFEQNC